MYPTRNPNIALINSSSKKLRSHIAFVGKATDSELGFLQRIRLSTPPMATETKPAASEDAKIDLFEDDDEFEEFEIDQEWDEKEEGKETTQQWEDDWDDDDVNDDFSLQLRKELESNSEKS
nr:unnamed protein product [Ananas comosus var. bracteatus]